jgi:protein arginine N-methyltransferase 2
MALSPQDRQLLLCLQAADEPGVRRALDAGADPASFVEATGESALMLAAKRGLVDAATVLLRAGAPWNALDRYGRCAGDYAVQGGHQVIVDELVSAGVRAELVFGAVTSGAAALACAPRNQAYLTSPATYQGDVLLEAPTSDAVMMEWERPLMELHAAALCGPGQGARVLNVGFGMGIVDELLQARSPAEHTIVEAHPDVLREMERRGWTARPGVRVVAGRWQDVLHALGPFEAVFFDTFGEHLDDLREFHRALPRLLAPGGAYSFFNGMCPNSFFFQAVACEVVRLELLSLGLHIDFHRVEVDAGGDDVWRDVARRYFSSSDYYLPLAVWADAEELGAAHRRDKKRVFEG